MQPTFTINLALAGDHALNLHALASLLGQQDNFRVVSISKDVTRLSNSLAFGGREYHPHIVLLDINFDLFLAAGIITYLKASHPDIRVVALGLTKDRAAVQRIRQMGADSYLPKNSSPEELEHVIRKLAGSRDNTTPGSLGPSATTQPIESGDTAIKAWPAITPTERRYFRLAMSEASHQDIRRSLKLCESTFTRLVTALYSRFGVSTRDGLVLALYRCRFMIMDDL